MTKTMLCALLSVATGCCASAADDNWPQFRGPGGAGLGNDKATLPSEFGPKKSVLWQIDLPLGHSSPCIWGDRIFITGYDEKEKHIGLIAVNRKKGKIAWRQTIPAKEFEEVHAISSLATSTPVTDGERIYVYSGSYGLLAYDWSGKLAWEYAMGVAKSPNGSGESPLLVGDLLIVTRDYPPSPIMFAIRKKDGTVAWKADLLVLTAPGPKAAHSTPLLWNGEIVLNRSLELSAYSPRDGARLWGLPTSSSGSSSPLGRADAIYVNADLGSAGTFVQVPLPPFSEALKKYDKDGDGKLSAAEAPADDLYFQKRVGVADNVPGAHFTIKLMFRNLDQNRDGFIDESEYNGIAQRFTRYTLTGILSIRPEGTGTLPPTVVQWSEPRGAAEVTTPLEYRGRLYVVNSGGIISCLDAKSGKVVYRGRLNAPGAYFASPVAAGGKVFVASGEGIVTVLGGDDQLEILSNNDLGEPIYGTPAFAGSTIYIRSARHLWAFGNP